MTIAFAVLFGVVGFLAGGAMQPAATRAIDESSPPLITRDDIPAMLGRSMDSRTSQALAIRLATALLMIGVVFAIGVRWVLPAYVFFVLVTVLLALTDLNAKLIPNRVTLRAGPAAGAMLVVGALLDGDVERIVWAAIGASGYFVFMLILALIVPGGLGFGDVKLAPILGAFVAAEHLGYVLVAALGSYVIGGLTSAVLLITRLKSRKDTIPFGPYMVIAAYVALFFGQAIVDWYLG